MEITQQSYGIDGILAVIDTANTLYDGFLQVTEDGKVDYTDSTVLFTAGPRLFASLTTAVSNRDTLDEEFGDIDDTEMAKIFEKAGSRIQNEDYKQILDGLLTLSNGIVKALKAKPEA